MCNTLFSAANLTPQKICQIKRRYGDKIAGEQNYWLSISRCSYCSLIWLEDVRQIRPIRINKKDRRSWVILTKKEDFGLLKANFIC